MINFKVNKNDKNIVVNVTVPSSGPKWYICGLREVKQYLELNNIKHGACLTPKEFVCNEYPKYNGTFIFESLTSAKKTHDISTKTVVKSTSRTRKTKKVAKKTKKITNAAKIPVPTTE